MARRRQISQDKSDVPATSITVHVPFRFRRRGGRKAMVLLNGSQTSPRTGAKTNNSALLRALVRAYRWQFSIDSGDYASIEEIATAEGITASYVGRILRLCRLCPSEVQAILDRRPGTLPFNPASLNAIPIAWVRST